MNRIHYTWSEFYDDCETIKQRIEHSNWKYSGIYGVPRGGVHVAFQLSTIMGIPLVSRPKKDDYVLVVDDISHSGRTREKFQNFDFITLHVDMDTKTPVTFYCHPTNDWIIYPWEAEEPAGEDIVTRILEFIGENPTRDGLIDTPHRVISAWEELFSGYHQNPETICKDFDGEGISGLVYLKDIEFYSTCEHHMLPFYGMATIAYIPNGRIIGASKLARILDVYAHRLQVQERIGEQVASAIMEHLKPQGVACIIEAKHLCIACRGVRKQSSVMGYSSLKGVFLDPSLKGMAARSELLALIHGGK